MTADKSIRNGILSRPTHRGPTVSLHMPPTEPEKKAWPKIAVFTGNYNGVIDGVALTTNRQVEYLERQGLAVRIFSPTNKQVVIAHHGHLTMIPGFPLPRTPYRIALGITGHVRRQLQDFQPDLIHIASPDLLGFAALHYGNRRKIPVVSTYHTHFNSYLKYYHIGFLDGLCWRLQRYFYQRCDAVHIAGESMRDLLLEQRVHANYVISPLGVDTDLFHPNKRSDSWRQSHRISPSEVVLLFVGRLVWEKSLDLFANVIRRLEDAGIAHRSMIVGEGPAGPILRQRLTKTIFTGRLTGPALHTAFASADIFLYPSDSETFGCVTVEALASGLACIVADATGSRDIIRHGIDGITCRAADENQFYEQTVQMIEQKARRIQYQEQGPRRAYDFRWESVLAKMLMHFRHTAGKYQS